MISFRQYLQEASVSAKPKYTSISLEDAVKFVNEHCKNAMWMIKKNNPLYRGDESESLIAEIKHTGFVTIDSSLTERRSRDSQNYYTMIFDHHPDYKDFPKRFRSFIAATREVLTGPYGILRIVIPADDAKIGIVNANDIWNLKFDINGKTLKIDSLNDFYLDLDLHPTIESFKQFDSELKDNDKRATRKLINSLESFQIYSEDFYDSLKNDFLKTIFDIYKQSNTEFDWCTPKTLESKKADGEVWISGPMIIMHVDQYPELRHELNL